MGAAAFEAFYSCDLDMLWPSFAASLKVLAVRIIQWQKCLGSIRLREVTSFDYWKQPGPHDASPLPTLINQYQVRQPKDQSKDFRIFISRPRRGCFSLVKILEAAFFLRRGELQRLLHVSSA